MIEETIKRIRQRVAGIDGLDIGKKKELSDLLETLSREVRELARTNMEHAESIARFAEASAGEATRSIKDQTLLEISLSGLASSAKGFEASHPQLVEIVNSVCVMLSNIGI